jgi:hypothetical protein
MRAEETPESPNRTSEPIPPRPPSRRTAHIALLAVAALQVFAVWFTMQGVGMAWDEAYYFAPNQRTVEWLGDWLSGNLEAGGHDVYWRERNEYLAVPRLVHGLSGALFHDSWLAERNLLAPLVAQRLLSGIGHGLNCFLIGLLLLPLWGLGPALAGSLAYATMPRIFGHAHFATTETLMITMTLLVTFAVIRGLHSGRWAIAAGLLFGLALNTKFNAILLPIPLWIWMWMHHRDRCVNNLVSMAFLGPITWLLTWPYVWHDTFARLLDYARWFLVHPLIPLWWHGTIWNWGDGVPLAPWWYTLEMVAVTVPLATLILIVIGVSGAVRDGGRDGRAHLFLLLAAVPILVASSPGAPRYDGVRLFLSAFAPLALLVGIAVARVQSWMLLLYPHLQDRRRFLPIYAALAIALVSLPGAFTIWRVHPYELSSFNAIVGGIEGGLTAGYETTAWCEAFNEPVIEHINDTLPEGASLRALAFHGRILELLQEWGILDPDIRLVVDGYQAADYTLLQRRQGFFGPVEALVWFDWPREIGRRFGWPFHAEEPRVEMILVTRTGIEFEQALARATGISVGLPDVADPQEVLP